MLRVSVAEHAKLSVFLARGLLRKLVSRVSGHALLNWTLPAKTDRLVISPQDSAHRRRHPGERESMRAASCSPARW